MFTNVINNINSFLSFSEEEKIYFLSLFEAKLVKKNEIFLKAGRNCNFVGYINKGIVRYYYRAGGREHTARIFIENEWVSEYAAFLSRSGSMVDMEALEDTELFTLSYEKVQAAYNKAKVFERFGRLMAEALFVDNVSRASAFMLNTAEERYLDLLNRQPQLFSRVPLKHIASLLGIEPESLSRIRKRMAGR